MQFGPADWSFLPNEFECIQTVWPFIKMSDWPFLRNNIDMSSFSCTPGFGQKWRIMHRTNLMVHQITFQILYKFFNKNYWGIVSLSLQIQILFFCSNSAPGSHVLVFVPMQTWYWLLQWVNWSRGHCLFSRNSYRRNSFTKSGFQNQAAP